MPPFQWSRWGLLDTPPQEPPSLQNLGVMSRVWASLCPVRGAQGDDGTASQGPGPWLCNSPAPQPRAVQ